MSLPDLTTDPAGYVLAVADLCEQRAEADRPWWGADPLTRDVVGENIAADHALAEAALWRAAARWWQSTDIPVPHGLEETACEDCALWAAVVAVVKAYAQETVMLSGG